MSLRLEHIADEVIETDFLVLGGGLVGCMAALRARQDKKLDVAIMEKGPSNGVVMRLVSTIIILNTLELSNILYPRASLQNRQLKVNLALRDFIAW